MVSSIGLFVGDDVDDLGGGQMDNQEETFHLREIRAWWVCVLVNDLMKTDEN